MNLLFVHDRIGGNTGMGQVAAFTVHTALNAGIDISIIASDVEPGFDSSVSFQQIRARRELPALPQHLEWCARVHRAIRRSPADLVHVYAPALLGSANIMTCHHLAMAAHQHSVKQQTLPDGRGLRQAQSFGNRHLDSLFYRRRPPRVAMTFVSEFLRAEFARLYGPPTDGTILRPPASPAKPVSPEERQAARAQFGVTTNATVVSYLGGFDPRKGLHTVLPLIRTPDLQLLLAGPHCERFGHIAGARVVGFVNPDELAAASDVILAPAIFDAAPVAVLQALARGIPVVLTSTVGWADLVTRFEAGIVWSERESLADAIRTAAKLPAAGGLALTRHLLRTQEQELLSLYQRALRS